MRGSGQLVRRGNDTVVSYKNKTRKLKYYSQTFKYIHSKTQLSFYSKYKCSETRNTFKVENRERSRRSRNINLEGQDQQRDNARWDLNWSENSDLRNVWNGKGSNRHWTNWRESAPDNQRNRRQSRNGVQFLGIVEPQPQACGSWQRIATKRTNSEPLSQEELVQDAYWNDFAGRESDRLDGDLEIRK